MANHIFKTTSICLAFFIASGVQYASSSSLDDMSANVFNFQQKLANSGNIQSQYKLGEMYEAGGGVAQNLDQAKSWYQQAASAGYAPASNRLTYLEIKANGYDPEKYADWVATVVSDADRRDSTSMLLLAQMHREGVGVKKDLAAARGLLDTLSTTGNLGVDREIALLEAELQANRKREDVLVKERAAEAQRLRELQQARWAQQEQERLAKLAAAAAARADKMATKSATKSAADAVTVATTELQQPVKTTAPESTMTAEEKARAEKRKRYEAVMHKLKEEQRILSEQQAWAEERD